MTNTPDTLFEWRRLRRKITFWRAATFVILAVILLGLGVGLAYDGVQKNAPHFAKIRIEGMITENEELIGRIEAAAESDAVKAIILAIDSPGGTTVGGEALYEAVRQAAGKKPVVTSVGTLAASAGYMIAAASDHIVARQSSIVGSIGVIVQFPNFSGLMDKWGIAFEAIKSSPLKAEPSMFNPTTDEERAVLQAMIDDSYDWFIDLVTERRPLSRAEVEALATGAVFTGRQALTNKLIDATGGEEKVLEWLASKDIDKELEIIEWRSSATDNRFALLKSLGALGGLGADSGNILKIMHENSAVQRLFLDGLLSIWHVDAP